MLHYSGSSGNTREGEDAGITKEIELMIFSMVVDAISRNWEVKGSAILKGWVDGVQPQTHAVWGTARYIQVDKSSRPLAS